MLIQHDGELTLAIGKRRRDTSWRNQETLWSKLLERLSETHRTAETQAQYLKFDKDEQDKIKDIGGFVGGHVSGGRRKRANILNRQLVTLDFDFAEPGLWDEFRMMHGYAAAMYTTHKHTPDKPRLRILVPLDRPATREEYEPIARRIAADIGIEQIDHTTYQAERLMYWPSTSKDGEYLFDAQDGPWISADAVLARYKDWRDTSEWPTSTREHTVVARAMKNAGDPLDKPGVVGAFCRTYSVVDAIETFLADKYTATDVPGRYTYVDGTTAGGLVVYDEDRFTYSHHGSDPTSGKLCNAFDLVRMHLYGTDDEYVREGTRITDYPSYKRMIEEATRDKAVRQLVGEERMADALADFEGLEQAATGSDAQPKLSASSDDVDPEWLSKLEIDKQGKALSTINNVVIILQNDPRIRKRLGYDEFEKREVALRDLPWRKIAANPYLTDTDDANIRHWLEKEHGITGVNKITDAVKIALQQNAFHPVRDYLDGLRWDGQDRLDMLLIDYLGAEDTPYTRTVTRKALVAAVARIYHPGVKFDTALVLVGEQGIGKSTIISRLGGRWFSDSLGDLKGKEPFEQLQGVWLVEMGELAGLKKADVDAVKHFIAKPSDRYRVAYGRRVEEFARQCVFFGTTNNRDFLRDPTGNRRFWPVPTEAQQPVYSVFDDLTPDEVGQVWAEAVMRYRAGEPLHLDAETEAEAKRMQAEHTEQDDRRGMVEKYLDTWMPENWSEMSTGERRAYVFDADDSMKAAGVFPRNTVVIGELWTEVFYGNNKDMTPYNTRAIHEIMRGMPGWERSGKIKNKEHGVQNGYRRTVKQLPQPGVEQQPGKNMATDENF